MIFVYLLPITTCAYAVSVDLSKYECDSVQPFSFLLAHYSPEVVLNIKLVKGTTTSSSAVCVRAAKFMVILCLTGLVCPLRPFLSHGVLTIVRITGQVLHDLNDTYVAPLLVVKLSAALEGFDVLP